MPAEPGELYQALAAVPELAALPLAEPVCETGLVTFHDLAEPPESCASDWNVVYSG